MIPMMSVKSAPSRPPAQVIPETAPAASVEFAGTIGKRTSLRTVCAIIGSSVSRSNARRVKLVLCRSFGFRLSSSQPRNRRR